jgi:capsular exopolysaccharide synthesis family protein
VERESELQRIPVEKVDVQLLNRVVVHTDPRSPGADRFRFLRMQLRELWKTGKLKSLLVTSPLPQDGKSTIALNLATVLAEGGKRAVVLVEADFHHPALPEQLGIKPPPGLAECLEGAERPMKALCRIEPPGFYLLPAGKAHGNPTDLLQTDALLEIVTELSARFDWLVIDSPPIIPLTDALILRRYVNASLLVARAGRTPHDDIEKAIALLGREHVLGIILNGAEGLDRLYSKYSEYYGNHGPAPGTPT